MKTKFLFLLMWLPLLAISQTDTIAAGVYPWKDPVVKTGSDATTVLFEGQTQVMAWLQVSANKINPLNKSKVKPMQVPGNEEQLLIIESGAMQININDSSYDLGAGSILLLMPKQKYTFKSTNIAPCQYYAIRYRSRFPVDLARGESAGSSLVKDWNKTDFKPGEKGGRRNFLERPTAMCKRLEVHATTLKEGLKSHAPHTHVAAEFTLIKEGRTQMQIGDNLYDGQSGSIYYAPSNVLHALENTGSGNCTYFAIQFE